MAESYFFAVAKLLGSANTPLFNYSSFALMQKKQKIKANAKLRRFAMPAPPFM
jgi:hypothetical protein